MVLNSAHGPLDLGVYRCIGNTRLFSLNIVKQEILMLSSARLVSIIAVLHRNFLLDSIDYQSVPDSLTQTLHSMEAFRTAVQLKCLHVTI